MIHLLSIPIIVSITSFSPLDEGARLRKTGETWNPVILLVSHISQTGVMSTEIEFKTVNTNDNEATPSADSPKERYEHQNNEEKSYPDDSVAEKKETEKTPVSEPDGTMNNLQVFFPDSSEFSVCHQYHEGYCGNGFPDHSERHLFGSSLLYELTQSGWYSSCAGTLCCGDPSLHLHLLHFDYGAGDDEDEKEC